MHASLWLLSKATPGTLARTSDFNEARRVLEQFGNSNGDTHLFTALSKIITITDNTWESLSSFLALLLMSISWSSGTYSNIHCMFTAVVPLLQASFVCVTCLKESKLPTAIDQASRRKFVKDIEQKVEDSVCSYLRYDHTYWNIKVIHLWHQSMIDNLHSLDPKPPYTVLTDVLLRNLLFKIITGLRLFCCNTPSFRMQFCHLSTTSFKIPQFQRKQLWPLAFAHCKNYHQKIQTKCLRVIVTNSHKLYHSARMWQLKPMFFSQIDETLGPLNPK